MRKKSQTCRQATHRRMGETAANNKENSFSSLFCSKGEIQDFRTKTCEPVTRGSPETASPSRGTNKSGAGQEKKICCKSRQTKRSRRGRNDKSPPYVWPDCNPNLTFPSSKYSSIAFYVPLNSKNADRYANIIEWNDLHIYESNATAMISRYQAEQKKKLLRDSNLIPESKPKYRSSSESSANSDDSIIFVNDDSLFDDEDCTSGTINSSMEGDQDDTDEPDCTPSCSGDNLTRRRSKKVRFADNSELVTVHVIVAWNYAYRAARISPWEVVARDSNRFKSKIQSLEPIISRVLRPEHRQKIWETRMSKCEPRETGNLRPD